jgi:tripartite-type tricarboxylate transporter receptor subunit TctC
VKSRVSPEDRKAKEYDQRSDKSRETSMKLGTSMIAIALASGIATMHALAQSASDYPNRGITLVMPLAAGSAGDVLGRIVAVGMANQLGKHVVAENVTGASGAIGIDRVLRAESDGYTVLGTGDNQLIYAPLFNRTSKFDPVKDFAPITQLAVLDWALVANPSFPAKTIEELVALAKAKPGEINFASGGPGSAQQVAMELLMARTGTKLTHVSYRGVTPGLNDVVAGQVQLMFTAVSVAAPFIPDGRLRVIATTGLARSSVLPNVPTVAESGLPGFEFRTWMGLLAKAGTDAAIIAKLNAAATAAVKDPTIRPQLAAGGFVPLGNSPTDFKANIADDYRKIADIMQAAGIGVNN